jgi:nucleoside-diphosphate-sugar epimerase
VKILITGGAGSVGRELTQALAAKEHQVIAFDLPVCDFSALEAMPGVAIIKGDIGDAAAMRSAVREVDAVLHLAALLPLASEKSREKTFAVNVGGARQVVEAIKAAGGKAHLVFSSTVATYGNTMAGHPPVTVDHAQSAVDIYGESKIEAERVVRESGIRHTILRISGIVIPALLEPPNPYPFMRDQRMEFVARADVVTSLLNAVQLNPAKSGVFNIAGGASWQMRGHEYVERIFGLLDVPIEDAHYRETPWWSDWYATEDSQQALDYQNTPFPIFLRQLDQAIAEAIG